MSIPDYRTIMLPHLKFAADGKERSVRDTTEFLAVDFQLRYGIAKCLVSLFPHIPPLIGEIPRVV
ncbi:MAG: hypothetical protein ACYS0I_06010 [Planctomycetota bacterium]